VHRRGIKEAPEILESVALVSVMPDCKVPGVKPLFFPRDPRYVDLDVYVSIPVDDPPVGFARLVPRHDDSQRAAFLAVRTNRAIEIVAGPPKAVIHEIVVKLREKIRGSEDLFTSFTGRQIRTRVHVSLDDEIQRDAAIERRSHTRRPIAIFVVNHHSRPFLVKPACDYSSLSN